MSDWAAAFVAILALVVVVVTPITAGVIDLRKTARERRESRYRERRSYFVEALKRLVELRGILQAYQQAPDGTESMIKREIAYGEAYAVILSISDNRIRALAPQIMQGRPEWVSDPENPGGGGRIFVNEKLDAINEAIKLLGDLVDRIMSEES
jgi:heme exporter protein D